MEIPITVSRGTAESGDYSVSGLTNGKVAFGASDKLKSFTVSAAQDADCANETVNLSIGTLPAGVNRASPSSATLTINDDDDPDRPPCTPTTTVTPGQVLRPSLTSVSGSLTATWIKPSGPEPTRYEVQHKLSSASWPTGRGTNVGNSLTRTISRLSAGTYDVRVRACNNAGCGGWSGSAGITVDNGRPAVTINTSGRTVGGGQGESLDASASDPNGDPLTYRWSGSGRFANSSALDTTWTAPAAQSSDRTYRLTITVSDGSLSTSASVSFTVRARTVRPTCNLSFGNQSVADRSWTQGAGIASFTLPLASGRNCSLTYSLSPALPNGVSLDTSTREVSGSPTATMARTQYTWRARDAGGAAATLTFHITVTATTTRVNDPPTVTIDTLGQTIGGGQGISLNATASDPDADPLTYSWSGSGTFADSSAADTTWTAPAAQNSDRTYELTITVSDGSLSDSDSVSFTVRKSSPPPDTRPTFGSATVNDQTYDAGSRVSLTLPNASGGDGRLTYSVSGLPPGLSFSGTDRRISGTATSTGSYQVTYSVEDSDGDTDSLGFTISVISPTPEKVTGLTAISGSAHGEIVLNWDPVNRADSYQVGQWRELPGDLGVGVRFDWEVLADSEVTIDLSNTSAVVRGLTPGISYEHSVRAVRVVGSDTFEGPWADGEAANAHDERPAVPIGLKGLTMIGGRGISLSWQVAMGAQDYEVEISDAGGITTTTVPGVRVDVTRLVPKAAYSFKVRSRKPHGSGHLFSEWSGAVSYSAPTPKHWWGHQADHIVRPVIGTLLGSRVIGDAIGRAITDWNDKLRTLNNDLEFCVTCTDDATVTVKAVNNENDSTDDPTNDPNEGCGPARGCVKPRTESASSGPGKHMKNMYVVIEEPPRSAIEVTMPSGTPTWQHWIWEWTADQNLAGRHVRGTMNPKVYYAYIDRVMLHEFGHTLGLDDFYLDNTMDHLDALMNESSTIEDEDLKQLRAIYSRHSPH